MAALKNLSLDEAKTIAEDILDLRSRDLIDDARQLAHYVLRLTMVSTSSSPYYQRAFRRGRRR